MAKQSANGKRPWHLTPLVAMSDAQYQQWVDLLEARTGIFLPPERKSFLLTSLSTRIRELNHKDYASYYRYLLSGKEGDVEWEVLVDRLTVHETRFFRDQHSLDLISKNFLPDYLADSGDPVRVWSVGCATGEEPYTLAMLLDDYMRKERAGRGFFVSATDISLGALAAAMRGRYRNNRGANLPAEYAERYTRRVDSDYFEVNHDLRQQVSFTQFNVIKPAQARPEEMDIIYCQNLLIYFKRERRVAILEHLIKHLRPGGILILGPGEITNWNNPLMKSMACPATLAFQRRADTVNEQGGGA